jgi:hypothetical protein
VPRDEAVERVRNAAAYEPVAEERSVAPHEPPAREALGLERDEEGARRVVVERKERQLPAPVGPGDDPRRPPAEASAGVVQQHGPAHRHAIQTSRENAMPAAALAAPSPTSTPVRSLGLP